MTGWDFLNNIIDGFPPLAVALLLVAAIVAATMFIIGFSKHGMDFIKHGLGQNSLSEIIANLATKEDTKNAIKEAITGLRTELMEKMATKEDIASLRSEFKGDMANLRTELKGDMADLRTEFTGLRTEFTGLRNEFNGLRTEFNGMENELATIKVNHFGHLKNFLTELTSILVDKGIFNNENKARLDNHLRGM